ncbi:helix-turn-helix transcriptional regulator [Streptomyces sp. TLI_171]|uniref:ArsR/SmtB family transcription factor n=1 Tax=Streptomyces sp. TLI_171 TaxID=1938859 RepID=UPI000C46A6C8|nr:helix-turn-helix domain-containing protein [Streptomyces sp. TLI_171]RKE18268.1 regulatory ArsR family protein [Streptomyces sp. TLI_171]
MALKFRLGLADLASAYFACSPLQEAVLSLRMWTHPGHYPHGPAFEAMRPAFEALPAAPLLRALVAGNKYVPDFLTPRPRVPFPEFRAELAAVRAFEPALLRRELEQTFLPHDRELPPLLAERADRPQALIAELADALEAYWTRVLEPAWWPRARSVLHADIVHRSRVLAERGAAGLFADLDHLLHWADGVLTIDRAWGDGEVEVVVDRRGLTFLPTCFARGALTAIGPDLTPSITYLARGQANLTAAADPPPTDRAVEQLLGTPKARLLALLHEPTATTELARRLGVTPGAVSQHLAVLHATRLVTRARHGRLVLYARSPLADQLLGP